MQKARAVTPSDTLPLPDPGVCAGLICSGTGNVNVVLADDLDAQAIVIAMTANVPLLGFKIKKVMATSTTATGIKALYLN
jgi:hypothetical protein